MRGTIRTSYRGWNITATCLKHPDSDPQAERRFTARAFAVLDQDTPQEQWRDARTQTASIADQRFGSAIACSQALLALMEGIIDDLSVHQDAECAACRHA
ncbi:MAG: hypothetical protein WKG03_07025 [Telluria sp.]